jgi:hypothetical protein
MELGLSSIQQPQMGLQSSPKFQQSPPGTDSEFNLHVPGVPALLTSLLLISFGIYVTVGMREKLATSFLLKVFWNKNTFVVKTTVFSRLLLSVSTDLQQLG